MPILTLVEGDITNEKVDAIVNAANSMLIGGGGVDGAIHDAAGEKLDEECASIAAKIGRLPAGGAVITGGYELSAKHVIHAVGPRYTDGKHGEPAALESAYRESMKRAREAGVKTIAFPSISTGVYGYPVRDAAVIAVRTVWAELGSLGRDAEARFVLFDADTFRAYRAAARKELPNGTWRIG